MSAPDLKNIQAVSQETLKALRDTDPGPKDPTNFKRLRASIVAARKKLPPLYRVSFQEPYLATLDELGAAGLREVLRDDPDLESMGGILMDSAHAMLQNASGYEEHAVDAFQEVVSDLYDGFLSAEDRRGVEPPDKGVIAPLVKFGEPDSGPYTFTIEATGEIGCKAGVVSMPPSHARGALAGWAALGHETAGHDILGADRGLKAQIASAVQAAVQKATKQQKLARYWASRIDETAADVMGILNMGPAAGIGVVAYFRGWDNSLQLSSEGPEDDDHPADVARGLLAAEVVRRLEFSDAGAWGNAIEKETRNDIKEIRLAGIKVTVAQASAMAVAVAKAIMDTPLPALETASLAEIQNWRNGDETIVGQIRKAFEVGKPPSDALHRGFYAAHVVAAALTLALATPGISIPTVFEQMTTALRGMHKQNPSWGPLFVKHPGNLRAHRAHRPPHLI